MSSRSHNGRGGKNDGQQLGMILTAAVAIIAIIAAAVSRMGSLSPREPYEGATAEAHFFDVGQGDSALFLWDGGAILFDAGTNSSQDRLVEYINELGVKTIDCAVFTHPHEDHIGGADRVLEEFEVKSVLMPDCESESVTYAAMTECIKEEGCPVYEAESGKEFTFGEVKLTVLSPTREYDDANLSSAVVLLEYGNTTFLFTGDCEEEAELDAIDAVGARAFDCDVLKVGHHGSYTSTSDELLAAATPKIAVISCGKDNEYGHPHRETLEKLEAAGVDVHRTDREGSVVVLTDGNSVWVNK